MSKYDEFIKLGEVVQPTGADVEGSQELLPCPFCQRPVRGVMVTGGAVLVGCDDPECPASDVSCFPERWNRRSLDASGYVRGLEADCRNPHPDGGIEVSEHSFDKDGFCNYCGNTSLGYSSITALREACKCLYLAVPKEIADDIKARAEAVIALISQHQETK